MIQCHSIFKLLLTLCICFSSFLPSQTFGQSGKLNSPDSLVALIEGEEPLVDSLRFLYLLKISQYHTSPAVRIKYAQIAKNIATEEDNLLWKRHSAHCLGYAYKQSGDLTLALEHFLAGLRFALELDSALMVANSYNAIATVYKLQNNNGLALDYYNKSISVYEKQQDTLRLASSILNKGELLRASNNLDSAISSFNISIQLYEIIQHDRYLAYAKGNLGLALAELGNIDNAEPLINEALETLHNYNDHYAIASYQTSLAEIYSKRDQTNKAIITSLNALVISEKYGLKEQIKDVSLLLSELFRDQGDYRKAYYHQNQYIAYRDSINNEEVVRQMADLRTDFEVSKKQVEVDLLSEKNRNANLMLYGALLGLLFVVGVAIVIYRALVANKKLSAINRRQADRLQQLDAAKSRFFANISHDLRSPLTLITGGINQVLQNKDVFLTKKAEQQLQTAQLNSERIIHMTGEINELIQLEEGKLTLLKAYVDLDRMLTLFEQMFSATAEQHEIEWSYTKDATLEQPIVHVDPHQFEKVLFNLITNAIKHTQPGDQIAVRLTGDDQNVQLSVSDTGEGIPPEKLPHIFERYFQAPDKDYKAKEGFGIGLALVQEIVHQHGAKIKVESKLGKGSTFVVTMPHQAVVDQELYQLTDLSYSGEKQALYRDIDDQLAGSRPTVHLDTLKKNDRETLATILVVEDHPEVRAYITDVIETSYQVIHAPNGLKALRMLETESVDLIITDLMMPWLDGFELLERLKEDEKYRKIPVLVLSARTSEKDKSRVLSQGVNDFLCKPFKPNELLQRVENLLNMKATWNNSDPNALVINNTETLADVEKSILNKVEQLIFDKIDDPHLSIGYLADQIAMSERNFYRMIKRLTDATPLELIKELRLQMAHKILNEKTVSNSSEVAKQIGINNVTHFNTQFKKRFGKSPKDLI